MLIELTTARPDVALWAYLIKTTLWRLGKHRYDLHAVEYEGGAPSGRLRPLNNDLSHVAGEREGDKKK